MNLRIYLTNANKIHFNFTFESTIVIEGLTHHATEYHIFGWEL